jgi:hypothetical protein
MPGPASSSSSESVSWEHLHRLDISPKTRRVDAITLAQHRESQTRASQRSELGLGPSNPDAVRPPADAEAQAPRQFRTAPGHVAAIRTFTDPDLLPAVPSFSG